MYKRRALWLSAVMCMIASVWSFQASAQTVLVDPNGGGGFESGTTFEANGWTVVNGSQTNKWYVGSLTTGAPNGGTRAAFVSNTGNDNTYSTSSSSRVYFYQDVEITEPGFMEISFSYLADAESSWDYTRVYLADASAPLPEAGTELPSSYTDLTGNLSEIYEWTNLSYLVPDVTPGTKRIVFMWRNDGGGGQAPGGSVDNILVQSSCEQITEITFPEITTTTAQITWPAVSGISTYKLKYRKIGAGDVVTWTNPLTIGANNTFTLNGLTPASDYEVQIAAIGAACEDFSASALFTTDCPVYEAPFLETFENNSNSRICWTVTDANDDGETWEIDSDDQPNNGSLSAMINTDFNDGANDDYLISPQFNLTGNEWMVFQTSVYSDGEPEMFEVLLSTTDTDPASFTEVLLEPTLVESEDYLEYSIPLADYSGQVYIAFHIPQSETDGWRFFIDDVVVEEMPSCIKPSALAATTLGSDQIQLDITPGYNEASYQIYFGPAPLDAPTETTGPTAVSSSTTYLAEELLPNTTYEFYVRSNCGADGTSIWAGPVSATTLCAVVDLPLVETFASTSETENCWTVIDANDDGDMWELNYSSNPYVGDEVAVFNSDYNSGENDDYLVSPTVMLTNNQRLMFQTRVQSASEPDTLEVLLSTTGIAPENFTEVLIAPMELSNTDYVEYEVDLSAYSGLANIAFHIPPSETDGWRVYIDEVIIEDIPTCYKPEDLAVTGVTSSEIGFNWVPGMDEDAYQIYYAPTPADAPDASTAPMASANDTFFTASDLEANTEYALYVRSVCNGNDFSVWSNPIFVYTSCLALDLPFFEDFASTSETENCWTVVDANEDGDAWDLNYTYNPFAGDEVATFYSDYNAGENDDYLISPTINLTGNEMLVFQTRVQSTSEPNDFRVLLSTTGTSIPSFTEVILPLTVVNTTEYVEYAIPLADYNGPVNVAFHVPAGGLDGWILYIDAVTFEEMPTCFPAEGMELTAATETSIEMGILAGYNETSWDVYYGEAPLDAPDETTEPTTTVNDTIVLVESLTQNTDYTFYVRSNCGGGEVSEWVGPFTVHTLCSPFDLPFTEGFNSTSETKDCWTVTDANGDGDAWDLSYGSNPYEGDMVAIFYSDYNSGNNDDYLISPTLNLTGNEWLKFHTRVQSDYEPEEMEVLLSTTGVAPANFTEVIMPVTTFDSEDYVEYVFDLTDYSGPVNIAFHIPESDTDGWRIYIDNVIVEEIPTCFVPEDLVLTNAAINSLSFSFTPNDMGSETEWEVFYGPAPLDAPDAETPAMMTITDTFFTATDLDSNTEYEFYVRANCGAEDGTSVWAGPVSGHTLCDVVTTIPFVESFEDSSETRPCWTQEIIQGTAVWTYNTGSSGGSVITAFEGAKNARFSASSGDHIARLISPALDLSNYDSLSVSFAYAQEIWVSDINFLNVYYRPTVDSEWTLVFSDSSNVAAWTEVSVELPEGGASAQIAFEGIDNYGYANVVDNVVVDGSIIDAITEVTADALLSVYPNPATSELTMKVAAEAVGSTVKVMSLDGKLLLEQEVESQVQTISIADLPAGMYILNIAQSNLRFVKQ